MAFEYWMEESYCLNRDGPSDIKHALFSQDNIMNTAKQLEIELFQGNTIYALYNQICLIRNLQGYNNSIMFNRIKLTNISADEINLKSCKFTFKANNQIIQKNYYDSNWINTEAEQSYNYVTNPMIKKYYCDVDYFSGDATDNINIASGQSLYIFGQYFEFYAPSKIDQVQISCIDTNDNFYSKDITISEYETKNNYILPMKGQFVISGGPYEIYGHRTKHPEEFGFDLQIIDNQLKPFDQDPFNEKNHHCFGEDIIAPADGKIVYAKDGITDNPIPYDAKSNGQLYKKNIKNFSFMHAAGGNYIVINHGNNEYSFLAHLMKESIIVQEGDIIKQGQIIAKCGNSGEGSTAPHLHYHLMNNPLMANARGLPIKFTNIQNSVLTRQISNKMQIPKQIEKVLDEIGYSLWSTIN